MIVYLVTNKVNGMQYVGQTSKTLMRRWNNHGLPSNKDLYFNNSILRYGKENFQVEQLHTCETKEEMNFVEMFYISLLNTKRPNGYNLTDGGEGCPGHTVSAEGRLRMREAQLGKKQSEGTKQKRSQALRLAYSEGRRTGIPKGHVPWNKGKSGTYHHSEESNRKKSARMRKTQGEDSCQKVRL